VQIDPGNTAFTPLDFVSYPYSHSLAALCAWGILVGSVYRGIAGGRRTFLLLAALVLSHWLLDYITHRPDMPLYPGSRKYGLGLWNSIPATIAVETAMYIGGLWIYIRSTRARDAIGRWAFVSLVVLLLVIYAANLLSPPPPSVSALWITAVAGTVVLTFWAWFADRHRDFVK
jgi:membrane-bound metal-dependent hydrolase YbcI (DUF457 family)